MTNFVLSPELLASIVGAVISLAFSYVPGLSTKFAALAEETKRSIMAGIMVVVGLVIYFGSCYGIFTSGLTCDKNGWIGLASIIVMAIVGNQSVFKISPQTGSVKTAKTGK